jgi:hypothetical protein
MIIDKNDRFFSQEKMKNIDANTREYFEILFVHSIVSFAKYPPTNHFPICSHCFLEWILSTLEGTTKTIKRNRGGKYEIKYPIKKSATGSRADCIHYNRKARIIRGKASRINPNPLMIKCLCS